MKIHCSEYGIHECEQFIPSEEFFMTKKNVREELLKSELPENNSNHSSDITLTNKDPEGIARLSPAVNSGSDILLSDKRKEVLKKLKQIHKLNMKGMYQSWETFRRVLDLVEQQDAEFIRLLKEDFCMDGEYKKDNEIKLGLCQNCKKIDKRAEEFKYA